MLRLHFLQTAAEESKITADLLPSNIEVYYPEKVANFSSMETEYKVRVGGQCGHDYPKLF